MRGLPGAIERCNQVADALAYNSEYLRSKLSPWFQRAAIGYVRASWYCRRSEPLTLENIKRVYAEAFVAGLKMDFPASGEDIRWKIAALRDQGLDGFAQQAANALKNRSRYKEETNPEAVKTDVMVLMLWLPALLWLMDDKLAAQAIKGIRSREGITPFKEFGITAKGYQTARLRLKALGLLSWHDFASSPPVRDICSETGQLKFAPASGQEDFQFGA